MKKALFLFLPLFAACTPGLIEPQPPEGSIAEGEVCTTSDQCVGELSCLVAADPTNPDATDDVAYCMCPDGGHDGGDGECVLWGLCSAGFHGAGDGTCLPEGECAPGYQLDSEGRCRLPPQPQSAICAQYVECFEHYRAVFDLEPVDLSGYEPGGFCWEAGDTAEACTDACTYSVESLGLTLEQSGEDPGPCQD